MNNRIDRTNANRHAQGEVNSAVLFVVGDTKMKDHAKRTNTFGRARTFLMALLMALTMMTTMTVSGATAYAANDTVHVATFDQLQEALEETQGVKKIVVDPQVAVEEGEVAYSVEDDENSDAFYIGFDEPLTVSHDIEITSAEDVDVYFARSDSFRRDQGKPALLNIDSTGNLNLDGLITMTGEEVTTTFYEADEENPAEFIFSVKTKDGTGEDNEAWNRGQALKGGFYIQNNGGEYTLGDDVIMEEINLEDDVEGVEQIHEVEKKTLSLFSSKKSDEEPAEEEAAEEEAVQEEPAQEEEVVVAPAPKKSLKSLKSAPLRSGGATNTEIASLEDLKSAVSKGGTYTLKSGIDITIDEPLTIEKNLTINGTGTIRRTKEMGTEPMFTVKNGKTFELGESVILSGIPGTTKTVDLSSSDKGTWEHKYGNYQGENPEDTLEELAAVDKYSEWWMIANGTTESGSNVNSVKYLSTPRGATPDEKGLASVSYMDSSDIFPETNVPGEINWGAKWKIIKASNMGFNSSIFDTATFGDSYMIINEDNYALGFHWHADGNQTLIAAKIGFTSESVNYVRLDPNATQNKQPKLYYNNGYDSNYTFLFQKDQVIKYIRGHNKNGYITGDNLQSNTASGGILGIHNPDNIEFKTGKKATVTDTTDANHKWSQADAPSGSSSEPKAFFIQVEESAKLNLTGATLTDYTTVNTYTKNGTNKSEQTPIWNAPVVVMGEFEMSAGEISNNTTGYCANEADSQASVQKLKDKITNENRTDTAGAMIVTGKSATGKISGTAAINGNRADAGAFIVTKGASVEMDMEKTADPEKPTQGIFSNIGWHHSGAILVENDGTFHLKNGSINKNVAWFKGGAVWATQYGTNGLVEWEKYPNTMKNTNKPTLDGKFTMDGGELNGNFAFARAGAIEVESNGVTLNSGLIANNMCKSLGGAIYVEGDSPIYSYTLNIKNGYIHHNDAVDSAKDSLLDKKLQNGQLVKGNDYSKGYNGNHNDGDWANWGDKQSGDGGGIWLCSMGGTSVFTSQAGTAEVVINNNTARPNSDNSPTDNGWGHDFYISRRYGSALVQNLMGEWVDDAGNAVVTYDENGRILKGPKGMENTSKSLTGTGIEIRNNRSRNGGGIAANGTIIMGSATDVYRYEAELDIEKEWKDNLTPSEVTIKLGYMYNDEFIPLVNEASLGDSSTDDGNFEEKQYYEVTLGTGDKDTINGNEVIYKTGRDSAKAFIPATVKHSNGETIKLYEIRNNQGANGYILGTDTSTTHIDTTNKTHLKALFEFISGKGSDNVPLIIDWNIVIKEEPEGKYQFVQGGNTFTASAKVTNKQTLINPDNQEVIKEGTFSVNLNTIKIGQELSNSPKTTDYELNKTDNSGVAIKKSAEFKLFTAKWRGENKNHWKIEDVTKSNTFTVDPSTGVLKLENLKYENTYLLFESVAPDGYKREADPWLVQVDSNGTVTARTLRTDKKLKHYNGATEQPADIDSTHNYLTDSNLANIEWPNGWMNESVTNRNLKNKPDTPHEIYKVNGTTLPRNSSGNYVAPNANQIANIQFLNGAEFKVYEASRRDRTGGGYVYTITDTTLGENDTELILQSEKVGDQDGVIRLPVEMNANETKTERYYLFIETQAPDGYALPSSAFALMMTKNGTTQTIGGTTVPGSTKVYAVNSTVTLGSVQEGSEIECTDFDDIQVQAIPNFPEITIDKVSSADISIPVNGAEFKIYSTTLANNVYSKNVELGTMVSKNGKISLPYSVSAGVVTTAKFNNNDFYWLEETHAAPGFYKAERPWVVEVRNGVLQAVKYAGSEYVEGNGIGKASNGNWDWSTISEKKLRNSPLKFKKVSASNPNTTLKDVKFEAYKIFNWNEEDDNVLSVDDWSGYTKDLRKDYLVGNEEVESDQNGEFSFKFSEAGAYLIFEKSVPNGYADNTKRPWLLVIKPDGSYQLRRHNGNTGNSNGNNNGYVNNKGIEWWTQKNFVKVGDGTNLVLENERTPIELTKVEAAEVNGQPQINTNSIKTIGGVSFNIYKANKDGSDWVRTGESMATLQSDATTGKFTLPSEVSQTAGEKYYWLVETESALGYVKSDRPWIIRVDDGALNTVYWPKNNVTGNRVSGDSENVVSLGSYVHNYPVVIHKTNQTGDSFLPNAEFKVHGAYIGQHYVQKNLSDDNVWGQVSSADGGVIDLSEIVKTRMSGDKTQISFWLTETNPPPGYKAETKPWLITVTRDGAVTVELANTLNKKEKNVEYWNKTFTSVADKKLKNEAKVSVFTKVDSDTERGLSGAEFELKYAKSVSGSYQIDDEKGTNGLHSNLVSGEGGAVNITDIDPTIVYEFLLFETKAPSDEYIRELAPWYIKIEDGEIVSMKKYVPDDKYSYSENTTSWPEGKFGVAEGNKAKNHKVYDLPKTGGMGTYWFMVIGTMMMTFAVTILFLRKKGFKKL